MYHTDGLGSITKLTSSTGAVLEQYGYDVYGKATIKNASGTVISATAYGNRFLFTGREYIAPLNLYNYRARFYSAQIGRFLQTDPIGHLGDLYNIYRYCGNNPSNNSDPWGLDDDNGYHLSTQTITGVGGDTSTQITQTYSGPGWTDVQTYTSSGSSWGWSESYSQSDGTMDGTGVTESSWSNSGQIAGSGHGGISGGETGTGGDTSGTNNSGGSGANGASGGGGISSGGGGETSYRKPDYLNFNVNIPVPIPYTFGIVSWSVSASIDRYGDWFFSPLGFGVGKSLLAFPSVSLTGDWLLQPSTPSRDQLNNFLTTNGINASTGVWVGAGASWTPGSGFSAGGGFVTPQFGVSYNYSFQGPGNTGVSW